MKAKEISVWHSTDGKSFIEGMKWRGVNVEEDQGGEIYDYDEPQYLRMFKFMMK